MLSSTLENMKNALKEKFNKNNLIVKPLYRKLRNGNKIKPNILIDSVRKLEGHDIYVKRNIRDSKSNIINKYNISKTNNVFVSDSGENRNTLLLDKITRVQVRNGLRKGHSMISDVENRKPNRELEGKTDKLVQADNQVGLVQKVPNTWLRLYPAPMLPDESIGSVIFRCVFCQLGLCTILTLWSVVWIFVIHNFEGPHEIKVSVDFEREQNLLVIELATELRQITPLSPKWRSSIERRIQDERHLTIEAVSRGARVYPGQFWDLSGTFLFSVYVMTALGFGAPVPQTMWGRTSALIYAVFAVPSHIYLMLNASMCIVVRAEDYLNQLRDSLRDKRATVLGRCTPRNAADSPNCSRSSEVLKSPNRSGIRKNMRLLSVLNACRNVPLIAILYYICGAALFGWSRGNTPQDIVMFPLEFTTSGGLDRVKGHVRIFYAFYVEGAMILLACGLANLRRHSSDAITCIIEKYRLLESE